MSFKKISSVQLFFLRALCVKFPVQYTTYGVLCIFTPVCIFTCQFRYINKLMYVR
ncbi:MAG: hypothetical protein JWP12_2088 [Bacteroidetes bacterium]|nr:hypothetical protein [Bacteroidota bacterium]